MEIESFKRPTKDKSYVELNDTDSEIYDSDDWERKQTINAAENSELQPLIVSPLFRNDDRLEMKGTTGLNVTNSEFQQKEGKFKSRKNITNLSLCSENNKLQTDEKVQFQSYDEFQYTDSELYKKGQIFQRKKKPDNFEMGPLVQSEDELINYTNSELPKNASKYKSDKTKVRTSIILLSKT